MRTVVPAYRKAVEDIASKIRHGFFQPGDQIYSRKEICTLYGISDMTAFKIHAELQKLSFVTKVSGKGLFVNSTCTGMEDNRAPIAVNKICLVGGANAIGTGTIYGSRLINGIRSRVAELNLDFRIEYIKSSPYGPIIINDRLNMAGDEGLITFGYTYPEVLSTLMNPTIATVTVERIFPESPAVLTDNYDGIYQLLEYLTSRGHQHIAMASRMVGSKSDVNENERVYFFEKEMVRRGLRGPAIVSGNINDLLEMFKSADAPTAIMFTGDDAALKFRRIAAADVKKRLLPLITGFDDIATEEQGLESLTTYHIECEKIGVAAVDALLTRQAERWQSHLYTRIPGRLVVRN
jgi:DNA-binding LacI/PurR family transcriptional regulator